MIRSLIAATFLLGGCANMQPEAPICKIEHEGYCVESDAIPLTDVATLVDFAESKVGLDVVQRSSKQIQDGIEIGQVKVVFGTYQLMDMGGGNIAIDGIETTVVAILTNSGWEAIDVYDTLICAG